jgi:hypothetical protein
VVLTGTYAFKTELEIEQWAKGTEEAPIPGDATPETQHIFRRALERCGASRATAQELFKLTSEHVQLNVATASARRQNYGSSSWQDQDLTHGIKRMNSQDLRRMDWMVQQLNANPTTSTKGLVFKPFTRDTKGGKTRHFDWWPVDYCVQHGVPNASEDSNLKPICPSTPKAGTPVEEQAVASPEEITLLKTLLESYGVNPDLLGKGESKSLNELATECVRGQCVLSEDAKKLVRVVDVVVITVVGPGGKIMSKGEPVGMGYTRGRRGAGACLQRNPSHRRSRRRQQDGLWTNSASNLAKCISREIPLFVF